MKEAPRIEKPCLTLQPRMQHVLPARRWTLTLSPPSPAALFSTSALSLLSDPPSRTGREREREWARAPNTDTFLLILLFLLLRLPLWLQNNCSDPGRVPEELPNSVHACLCACGCLCSLWTGPGSPPDAAGLASSARVPRSSETLYIRPR